MLSINDRVQSIKDELYLKYSGLPISTNILNSCKDDLLEKLSIYNASFDVDVSYNLIQGLIIKIKYEE